ncbi:MAG: rod shape-determining protein MreC [Spirochaetia bacterium]
MRLRQFTSHHKTGVVFAALIFVCVIILIFSGNKMSFRPKEVGQSFFSIFQAGFSEVGDFFSRTAGSIRELKKLRAEYETLQDQLNQYKTLERDLVELKAENRKLRDQLDFSGKLGYEHVPAQIIAKDPGSIFNSIVIDKGKMHGVERNMPVIAYQEGFHGFVGKVISVGSLSSVVLPLYDQNCKVAARMQKSRYEGLVTGNGSVKPTLTMLYVKKHARNDIRYDDIVITSGMNSIYPTGIYLGRVREIGAKEYEPSLEIEIEPIIDFSRLEHVFVLKTENE